MPRYISNTDLCDISGRHSDVLQFAKCILFISVEIYC